MEGKMAMKKKLGLTKGGKKGRDVAEKVLGVV